MLFFKLYASRCVTPHPVTRNSCRGVYSKCQYVQKKRPETEKEPQCSLCHHKQMELFSYRTRSGWLPQLSLLPCSWRCKCNLLHPLSWHLLLPILNHPRSGCTYHPFQGQCCYCSRGGKRGKRHDGVHFTNVCLLEEPTNTFLTHWQWSVWSFILGREQLAHREGWETKKAALHCMRLSSSPVFPQLLFASALL